ncbi:phospholipase D/nuclease, partial [Rhizoclosmatium globosum]
NTTKQQHQIRLTNCVHHKTNQSSSNTQRTPSISLIHLTQPLSLRKAFLSAFQFDLNWIASTLPPNIPVCLAFHSPSSTPPRIQKNICIVFPKLNSTTYATMHIKLCVLYFDGFVRVVVSSANLVQYDWEELENIVWYQDFPRKEDGKRLDGIASETPNNPSDEDELSLGDAFKSDLKQLLLDMESQSWVYNDLDAFDFSSCRARLVISKPGKHSNDDAFKYGLGRLSSIVHEINGNKAVTEPVSLWYQTSSLGSISQPFITSLESACRGSLFLPSKTSTVSPSMKIVFPTIETVKSSALGMNGAGTITWSGSLHAKCEYKHLLRDSVSLRSGALSHCKVILCRTTATDDIKWFYCGSHNMTMSAWGKTVETKKEKRVEISNWELGVVVEEGAVVPFQTMDVRSHGSGVRAAHTS